jgi:hypothetical protein
MPYFTINKYKIFLSHNRGAALNRLAMAHKGPEFRIESTMEGPKALEADELRFQYLTHACKRDPQAFCREWVEFDLRDREAQDNAWDLLYDYCALYRIGYLMDMRSKLQVVIEDIVGDSYTYPMGRIFGLRILGGYTLASLLQRKSRPMVTLIIDTSQVVSASGTLDNFQLQFRHCTFHCGRDFSIALIDSKA